MLVPPSVKPVVGFDPKSPLPKPTDGADVVAVAVEEPRVPKLSPPVELLQNKTVSNYFFKWKIQPPLISVSFPHHHCPDQSEHRRAGQSQSSLPPRRNPPPSLSFSYLLPWCWLQHLLNSLLPAWYIPINQPKTCHLVSYYFPWTTGSGEQILEPDQRRQTIRNIFSKQLASPVRSLCPETSTKATSTLKQ